MATLLSAVASLFWLGSIVCFIMVAIKLIQNAETKTMGIVSAVLFFCCGIGGLIAFVLGWMNADKLGIKNIMLIWTGCIIGSVLFGGASGAMGGFQLDMPR